MPAEADVNLRYFAADGCVDHSDEPQAVYVGGKLIGTFTDEQPIERDLLIVAVCQERRVRAGRVAEAFGVSTETVRRVRRRFEAGGAKAMAKSHRRGRPRRRTPQLEQRLVELFEAGASISEAHRRICRQVSRTVVAQIRKRWSRERTAAQRLEPDHPPPAATLPVVTEREMTDKPEPPDEAEPLEEELPTTEEFELELEQAVAEGGRQVQHLGSWIMLAMVNALGLYATAERLRAKAATKQRKAGKRFIGRATLRAALDAVAVALSIGKRCVEGVRWLATPSGATLLRRAAPMSATWTRRVLGRFASPQDAAVEFHWQQAMSLLATATESDDRAVFFIDNHQRPYTGQPHRNSELRFGPDPEVPGAPRRGAAGSHERFRRGECLIWGRLERSRTQLSPWSGVEADAASYGVGQAPQSKSGSTKSFGSTAKSGPARPGGPRDREAPAWVACWAGHCRSSHSSSCAGPRAGLSSGGSVGKPRWLRIWVTTAT